MQASWRLREQKRREEAEAAERRRAVEKSEISFPSLGNTNTGWDAPKTNETTVAAQRWSEGDVVRSTTPRSAAAAQSSGGGGGAGKPASSVSMGIHARIAAEVRRQTTAATAAGGWQYEDEHGGGGAAYSDGWTEVSKTKTKKAAPPPPPQDYDYDCEY